MWTDEEDSMLERNEGADRIDARRQEHQERLDIERHITQMEDVQPRMDGEGTPPGGDNPGNPPEKSEYTSFRYYDLKLGGEIHTSVSREGGIDSQVQADLYRDGERMNTVGTAHYRIEGSEAIIQGDAVIAANHRVESSLLNEVSQQARDQGAERLWVWSPDNSAGDGMRWARQGFQPAERDPGAAGVYWQRPLA